MMERAVLASAPKRKPGRQVTQELGPTLLPLTICSRHHASGARRGAERLLPQKPADDGAPNSHLVFLHSSDEHSHCIPVTLCWDANSPRGLGVFQASHPLSGPS